MCGCNAGIGGSARSARQTGFACVQRYQLRLPRLRSEPFGKRVQNFFQAPLNRRKLSPRSGQLGDVLTPLSGHLGREFFAEHGEQAGLEKQFAHGAEGPGLDVSSFDAAAVPAGAPLARVETGQQIMR